MQNSQITHEKQCVFQKKDKNVSLLKFLKTSSHFIAAQTSFAKLATNVLQCFKSMHDLADFMERNSISFLAHYFTVFSLLIITNTIYVSNTKY